MNTVNVVVLVIYMAGVLASVGLHIAAARFGWWYIVSVREEPVVAGLTVLLVSGLWPLAIVWVLLSLLGQAVKP